MGERGKQDVWASWRCVPPRSQGTLRTIDSHVPLGALLGRLPSRTPASWGPWEEGPYPGFGAGRLGQVTAPSPCLSPGAITEISLFVPPPSDCRLHGGQGVCLSVLKPSVQHSSGTLCSSKMNLSSERMISKQGQVQAGPVF